MTERWSRLPMALLGLSSVLAVLVLGYDGERLFQVLVLALPGWLWLWWPSPSQGVRGIQVALAALTGLLFVSDGAVRAFILGAYGAHPSSTMVLTAVANTTPQETSEFLAMYWPAVLGHVAFALLSLALLALSLAMWWRHPPVRLKAAGWRVAALGLLLCLVLVALINKPWRHHHPMLFWSDWVEDVTTLKRQWSDLSRQRERWMERARQQAPVLTSSSPDTLVLVISESINRNHLSLYGYPRDTTPELLQRQRQEAGFFGVFRHAWSVDAATIPALRSFFHFGQQGNPSEHLLALAASAGYRTWWISNHDDLAIEQEHARLANHLVLLNRTPGRSSPSLDDATLPALAQALQDPAPRKLVVLHLLGAHPHYELRSPPSPGPFDDVNDEVYRHMKAQGRSAWLRALRNEYDSALHYHDSVVAQSLDLTRQADQNAVWVYFSDHGQEVGSTTDHAGHSASTAEGYRVPLLVWGRQVAHWPAHTAVQPVRTDWLGYTVMSLLGIAWEGHEPAKDVLAPRYQWQPPALSVSINFRS